MHSNIIQERGGEIWISAARHSNLLTLNIGFGNQIKNDKILEDLSKVLTFKQSHIYELCVTLTSVLTLKQIGEKSPIKLLPKELFNFLLKTLGICH